MGAGLPQFESFLVTIPSAMVIAVVFLLLFFKMVDGEIPLVIGLVVMFGLLFLLYQCVAPPHPMLPGIILVTIITIAVLFPFVEGKLNDVGLEAFEVERMERALQALEQRPDNIVARFEVAKRLYELGFAHHAVAFATAAFDGIKDVHDDFANRSLRDQFAAEARMVRSWKQEGLPQGVKCPTCGATYAPGILACERCQRNYVLDLARSQTSAQRLWGRIILAGVAVACTVTGVATMSLAIEPNLRVFAALATVAILGGALYFLFGKGKQFTLPSFVRD